MVTRTRVALEAGKTWVFATALDWPGWCRRGKGEEAALAALDDYAERYAAIAGTSFKPGPYEVVGRVASDMHADFGAPGVSGSWDSDSLTSKEILRLTGLVESCWTAFDKGLAKAPAELAKGPRGGGRDRDAIADHVREAERAYTSRAGTRVPPRTPWPEQRAIILDGLRQQTTGAWPTRYAINRVAWHVTDHLWEIEDKS
ncbi:hypothetical protein acdb102_03420 [Acidothermaceae bacterium B102]|nr:hypothetical protein acdb102_03420 [Acidothermaceae bacterium B102]